MNQGIELIKTMQESVLQKERGKKHLLLLLGEEIEEASQVGVTRGDLLGGCDGMGSAQYPILPYTGWDCLPLYVCNGGVTGRV